MQKTERLNDMLIYLKDKKTFNLKSIMERYSISKSTALRDIQSLEKIGMPIYSRPGRNGFYGILPNRLLSPIVFTIDEVQALYFSMQTLNAYQSTPFHLSIDKLKQKFEACISDERAIELNKIEEVFSLASYQNKNVCHYLKYILQMTIEQQVCKVIYLKKGVNRTYYLQFFNVTSAYGQWYATSYNFETSKPQVLRCDKISHVEVSNKYQPNALEEMLKLSNQIFRSEDATDFEIGITEKGADMFYKEHYPSMELVQKNGKLYVKGFFNRGEENFIADYLMMYGENITSIKPTELKKLLFKKITNISHHISVL